MALTYFIIFIFGLAVGSFLNSIIYRLQTEEGLLFQRSYCPHCKKKLSWQELIPLLSFLALRGRCKNCKNHISFQYPLVELVTAGLFVLTYQSTIYNQQLSLGNFLIFPYLLVAICFLIIIFVFDLKYYIIPDKIIYPAILITFFYCLLEILNSGLVSNFEFRISNLQSLLNPLLSAILASAFFLAIVLISKGRWMGWGDPKLAFFMGLFLGFPNILIALFLSFLIGAIIGIGLIIFRKKTLKSEIPFGPFLVTGTLIALFWGNNLINWYLHLFW